jgi:hypothetical protein
VKSRYGVTESESNRITEPKDLVGFGR